MSLNPITIRNLGPEDAHIIDRIKPGTFENLDPSRAWALLATRVNELVVALDRGEVVGYCYGTMVMHLDKPSEFFVSAIGVHPEHRRQGVATRMLRRLHDLARDRGCERVWVLSAEGDEAFRAFLSALDGNDIGLTHLHDWPL